MSANTAKGHSDWQLNSLPWICVIVLVGVVFAGISVLDEVRQCSNKVLLLENKLLELSGSKMATEYETRSNFCSQSNTASLADPQDQDDSYVVLSSRIDRLDYLLKSCDAALDSANGLKQLGVRIDLLTSQYSALIKGQGSSYIRNDDSTSNPPSDFQQQYLSLREEVYQLHSFLVKEVENLVTHQMEDALSSKDRLYERLLNEQLATMDKYVIAKLNVQSEAVAKQLNGYVNSQASKLEKSLIDEMNRQLLAMNDYVVDVVSQQVLALEEHFRKILVEMVSKHLDKVDKLENRIVRWSLLLHNDGSNA